MHLRDGGIRFPIVALANPWQRAYGTTDRLPSNRDQLGGDVLLYCAIAALRMFDAVQRCAFSGARAAGRGWAPGRGTHWGPVEKGVPLAKSGQLFSLWHFATSYARQAPPLACST